MTVANVHPRERAQSFECRFSERLQRDSQRCPICADGVVALVEESTNYAVPPSLDWLVIRNQFVAAIAAQPNTLDDGDAAKSGSTSTN